MEFVNFFEQRIQKFNRRIKAIEESTDPTVFRSYRLLIELMRDKWVSQLEAVKQGKPKIEGWGSFLRYYKAMGFEPFALPSLAEYTTDYTKNKIMIETMGFPEKCCERVTALLVMCNAGELPYPDIVHTDGHGCDPDKYYPRSLSDLFNIPTMYIDIPLDPDDKPKLAHVNYVADQLEEFIEFAEKKIPGIKYDKDKHIEMQEIDRIAGQYRKDIYEFLKHVPCPLHPDWAIEQQFDKLEPSRYPDMKKGLEYFRMYRDELGEMVASGRSPYPEERLRIVWAGHTHEMMAINPCNMLLERKVAMPITVSGNACRDIHLRSWPIGSEVSEYGAKLSPLQEEAKTCLTRSWGGPGRRWPDTALTVARDMGAQGIIHYLIIGCTPMMSMGSVLADRAEKELGIPTLNLEGRLLEKEYMTQEKFDEILSSFIDKCFDWAGKPRQ